MTMSLNHSQAVAPCKDQTGSKNWGPLHPPQDTLREMIKAIKWLGSHAPLSILMRVKSSSCTPPDENGIVSLESDFQ